MCIFMNSGRIFISTMIQRIVIVTIIEIKFLNKLMIVIVKKLFYDHKEDMMKYSR